MTIVLLLAVVAGGILRQVPLEISAILAFWVVGSLPLGVVVGHCALSEG